MYRTVTTKQFNKHLTALRKKGKKGKDAIMKTKAALSEAGLDGEISSLKLTRHGESRLREIEKYDLGDGYRLVVQVVNPAEKQRAFLFVGDHEDADQWLDNHRDYQWVQKDSDKTLEFVQVSVPDVRRAVVPDFDLESPDSLLDLPLLRDVSEEEWADARIPQQLVAYLKSVTASAWEQDPAGIMSHVEENWDTELACLTHDLLEPAHRREWDAVHRRLEVCAGQAKVIPEAVAADVMVEPQNSERFVTWTDLALLPENSDWADWMLFMHPEQNEFAEKSYNGPTRLRGVSGSGKTCVMIHRARRLAKKYREKVLLVTLTESMRKLLDLLVNQLCMAEAALIETWTMTSFVRDVVDRLAPRGTPSYRDTGSGQQESLLRDALREVRNHEFFPDTVLSHILDDDLPAFVEQEINYVRTRFLPREYSQYLTVNRYGRSLPLREKARQIILSAVRSWDTSLEQVRSRDFESIAQTALMLLNDGNVDRNMARQYRCVLVDEVQDLSQVEMRILGSIAHSSGKPVVDLVDGMFLVGDGAQTVYRRGFTFKACGISVANRSFVLQKNYRNTREILEAAYGLIQSYEFADVDEENIRRPTSPHWSSRHGEKPWIVRCDTQEAECAFITNLVAEMCQERDAYDDAEERVTQTELPICVIGFNRADRDRIQAAFEAAGIASNVLKEDVSWATSSVKVSTLESAKGHEFQAVFLMGVTQGSMPNYRVPEEEWYREAARLYVGMTRARDRLFLTYDRLSPGGPSVFLAAIQGDCHEYTSKDGKLSEAQKVPASNVSLEPTGD